MQIAAAKFCIRRFLLYTLPRTNLDDQCCQLRLFLLSGPGAVAAARPVATIDLAPGTRLKDGRIVENTLQAGLRAPSPHGHLVLIEVAWATDHVRIRRSRDRPYVETTVPGRLDVVAFAKHLLRAFLHRVHI